MTDRTATISVRTVSDLSGTQELTAALSREALAAGDAAAALTLMDQALGKTTTTTQAGTAASLSAARAEASLAVALGDRAGAIAILEAELATQEERTNAVIRAETQLTQIENQVVAANEKAAAAIAAQAAAQEEEIAAAEAAAAAAAEEAAAAEALGVSVEGATAAVNALGLGLVALQAVKIAASLIEQGGAADRTATAFNHLATQAGTTGAALLSAMKNASHGEISDMNLELEASKAEFLGVAHSAQDFSLLLAIARNNAQEMGLTTQDAFDKLVDGLDKGSARALKQVGLNVDLKAAEDKYAASIGTTASQLDAEGKKQALVAAAMEQGKAQLEATGGAIDNLASGQERLGSSWDNIKTKVGTDLAGAIAPTVNAVSDLSDGFEGGASNAATWAASLGNVTSILTTSGAQTQATQDINHNFATGLLEWVGFAHQATDAEIARAAATQQVTVATAQLADTIPATSTAIQDNTQHVDTGTAAMQAHAAEVAALMGVTEQSVTATLADAAAKEEVASKTQLLTAETNATAQAFMLLNPNISESGIAALEAAGKLTPEIANLIQVRLRALDAANALIAFNNAQNVKGVDATIATNRAAGRMGRGDSSDAGEMQAANDATAAAAKAARDQQTLAVGTKNQKVALLQEEYNAAVKEHGAESAAAIDAQTKLMQAQDKGSKARTSAGEAAAKKEEALEGNLSEKVQGIVRARDDKLAALQAKADQEQLIAAKRLADDIASTQANRRVNDEVDDLDLVGPHTKDEARKLNDRERAEADARKRSEENAAEARKQSESGEAELAQKTLAIKEKQNDAQQSLDQKYYARQAELGKNPELQAALKQQYDEATKAIADQAATDIATQAELNQEKKDARDKEHDDIIASAQDAANVAIGHAQRMSDSIIKATGTAGNQGADNIKKIGDAAAAIPKDITVTVHIAQEGSTSVGGSAPSFNKSAGSGTTSTHAAGGGTFVTHGLTKFDTGDNPGGVEVVTVTPVSGVGKTTVGPGAVKMAGGGTTIVDTGGGYTAPVAQAGKSDKSKAGSTSASDALKSQVDEQKSVVDLLESLIKLREDLNVELQNGQPFNTAFVVNLADRAASFLQIVLQRVVPITKKNGDAFTLYVTAAKDAIGILGDVADLRKKITEDMDSQPFDTAQIAAFAWRARQFLTIVESQLVPTTQTQVDALSHYQDAESAAISILKDVADLRKALADSIGPQPDLIAVSQLALTAARVTQIVEAQMLPTTEEQAKALSQYHDAAEASIGLIKDTSDLAKTLTDNNTATPIDLGIVQTLAADAARVTAIVESTLIPTTDDQAKALQTWSDASGASVGVIKDVSDLGKTMTENASLPLDVAEVTRLANDARRVTAIVQGTLTPTTEDQAKSLQNWSDAVGAGVSVIKDTTTLTSTMFTDYVSPTDAQIAMIAKDAKRVTDGLSKAAATYSADGLTAGKAYADMAGATFGAFKDGLLFFDALKSGDYALDTKALAQFETSTAATMEVARRLGAIAVTIPAANLAALGATTTALSNQAEAMIKLAAVPFGDLPGAAAGLANQANALLAGGGGAGVTTFYNSFQISGPDANTVVNMVMQRINTQIAGHR